MAVRFHPIITVLLLLPLVAAEAFAAKGRTAEGGGPVNTDDMWVASTYWARKPKSLRRTGVELHRLDAAHRLEPAGRTGASRE